MEKIILYLKIILLLAILTVPQKAFSQLVNWENYTCGDILAKMYNDGEYLWIATDGGLVKYNKITEEKSFYTHANTNGGLPENHLRSITKDEEGNLWVGTEYNGIGKFNGVDGVSYFQGIQQCYVIKQDSRKNIWFSGDFHINKFDGDNLEKWTTPGSSFANSWFIMDMESDREDVMWIAGNMVDHTGYSFYFAKFTEEDGIQPIPIYEIEIIDNIEIDNNDNIWLAGRSGLIKYMRDSYLVFNKENSNLPSNSIHTIKIDETGIIWLVSGNYLVRYDGETFTSYEIPMGDNYNFMYSLEVDSDGTVWLGSRISGLIRFKDGVFKQINISNSPLLTNDVAFDLDVDLDGNVWIGTRHNLVQIDPNDNWSSYYEDINYDYYQSSRVTSAKVSPTGDLWIALGRSDTCVVRKSGNNVTAFTVNNSPLVQNSEPKFYFDKKGNTWLSSKAGLYKYNGSVWQRFTTANTPLNSNQINGLAFDQDDNLWGTAGRGQDLKNGCVFKYDGTNWTIYTEDGNGLPTSMPTVLKFDSKGILWIHFRDSRNAIGRELGGGLTRFDGSTWTSYTINNSGIPSNTLLDIEIDRDDNLWLATSGAGITKYDGTTWNVYNTSNSGLASNLTSGIALDYHRDKIWITHMTNGGISVADLNSGNVGIETINQNNQSKGFDIYPNPAKNDVTIRLNFNFAAHSLEILDISGRVVARQNIDNHAGSVISLSLSELNIRQGGLYLVKVTGEKGTYTQRLLVKN